MDGQAAELGGLPPDIRRDLIGFRDFALIREQALAEIVGAPNNRSQLRECIIRQMMLAYTDNRILHMSEYQALCRRFASAPAIRTEIDRLKAKRVVTLRRSATDLRVIEVWPTLRTVTWYRTHIPELRSKIRELLRLD
jgi:hypothetical protein